MSGPTTSRAKTSPSATPSSSNQSPAKNNTLTIIIVAAVGGIIFIVALVLIVVPFARRRAARRKKKQAEGSSSSDVTSTTIDSRREVHNRTISVDASVPLLEPNTNTTSASPEYSRFGTLGILTAQQDSSYTPSSTPPTPSTTTSLQSPRLFAPTFSSFSARPLPESEPGPPPRSRFIRSAPPQQPLRHTRTRIARMPMDTLPEDLPMDTKPARSPSPPRAKAAPLAPAPAPSPPPSPPPLYSPASSPRTSVSVSTSAAASTSTAPPAPSPPPAPPSPSNWLHIPKAGGIPLISAFRQSLSSVASRGSSLPTMQHYPSFNKSQNAQSAASGSTRSSQTFYSAGGSVGHGNGNGAPPSPTPPVPPLPSEHGELPRPPPPRLKPGGGGERVTQVHLTPPEGHHAASRQASMVYSQNSASAVPGSLRPGANSRPVSSTVGSGSSSLSLYVDARSQIGGASGDDGRSNGSVGGSAGSARGRVR